MLKYLPLVWAGIWRKRGRAVLMLLQIASAFALFGLLEGFNTGIKQAIAKTHGDRLYIGSSVSLGDPLPINVLARIRSTPGVRFATARSTLPGTYQQPDQQLGVIAVDVGPFFEIYDEYSTSPADIDALESNRTGTLVGRVTMQKYGWKVGQRVVLQSPLPKVDGSRDWAFDIVGVYDRTDDAAQATELIGNHAYLDESRIMGRDSAQLFVAKAHEQVFDMLREMLMWMSQDEEWGREMRDINNYYNLDRINTFSLRRKVAKHVIEAGGYAL